MNTLDLSFISRFRSSFMGFAIFWIFFYHTGVDIPVLKHFFALGWLGVDIFSSYPDSVCLLHLQRTLHSSAFFAKGL